MSTESEDQPVEQPVPESDRPPAAGKNIVVLCDGTANQVSVYSRTNVVRLARRLAKTPDDGGNRQVVFYDPGLGTESAPGALTTVGKSVTKLLGLAFGYGLSKNLADAYAFLVQHYEPGDRIYIFGFSRGAYTARALTGLLGRVGLLERGCDSLITYAVKYYRARDDHQLNFFKQRFSRTYPLKWRQMIHGIDDSPLEKKADSPSRGVIPVHFLGVWDTVKSIGTLRRQIMLPDTDWLPNMINGRHAVAIDEKRSQYKPEIWQADTDDGHGDRVKARAWRRQTCLHQDVETMWFTGVHADVGGGYGLTARLERKLIRARKRLTEIEWRKLPEARQAGDNDAEDRLKKLRDGIRAEIGELEKIQTEETGLAYFPLAWMVEAAKEHGLRFNGDVLKKDEQLLAGEIREGAPKLHNPLFPCWWVLGWKRRTIPPGAQIHPG